MRIRRGPLAALCVVWLLVPHGSPAAERSQIAVGQCILEAPVAQEGVLRLLARQAEEILPRLEAELGVEPVAPYFIVLIPPPPVTDPELARLDALAPQWAGGFLVARSRVGAIRLGRVGRYPHGDLVTILVHESVHMLLHDAAGEALPRWFEEGIATWHERRWGLRDVVVYSSSLLRGKLPPLAELDGLFGASAAGARAAYATSFEFVSWSVRKYGPEMVPRLLAEARERPFPEAWRIATGVSLSESEERWRRSSLFVYRWLPILSGSGTLWLGITALALLATARRRRRTRELLDRWDQEDGRDEPGPDDPIN